MMATDSESDEYTGDSSSFDVSKPRLNMSHGFIHHIRRNQIARDNYDKQVKQESEEKRTQTQSAGKKRPENKMYVPPGSQQRERRSHVQRTSDATGKILYKLEYTSNNGSLHSLIVRDDDDPGLLAKRLQRAAGIQKHLLSTLEWKIEQEQSKRRSSKG